MSRPINYKKKFLSLIEQLHKNHPTYDTARHLSTALADYGDFWGLPDKELCFAVQKYIELLALDDVCIAPQDYVDRVVKDTQDMFSEYGEDEYEEDYD